MNNNTPTKNDTLMYLLRKLFCRQRMSLKQHQPLPPDYESAFLPIFNECHPFTMTSSERLYALYKSIEYITKNNIEGDIVECGVWKGGSIMCVLKTLMLFKEYNRHIYLYDTFEGMSAPSEKDIDIIGELAAKQLSKRKKNTDDKIWAYAPLESVINNIAKTQYPLDYIRFVKGKVEETIPETIPNKISLLRLDTDWYASTYHELVYLYPRLVKGGVLIIDDYGHWKGAKEAVEKYFEEQKVQCLLHRIDYTGRILVKQ